jgi:crotonobetainyl-CoA:carnitine CoA-transferase CaiB-like acyl-CoA transferase
VVELAHPFGAFAGKLMADAGADVIVVEPPQGSAQRHVGPYADDRLDRERSLAWWADNTSKRSVVVDLTGPAGLEVLGLLVDTADVLVECLPASVAAGMGLDPDELRERNSGLVHVTITPRGRHHPRSLEAISDLTLLAGGGPVWSCGYDDHELPPVRGGGDQGIRTAAHFAVMSALTALLARDRLGQGQHVDVSMNAAVNVTTEFASYSWLAAGQTVQRQTGRHALPTLTEPTQVMCADGRWLNTGVPPRTPAEFARLHAWLVELDLVAELPLAALLEMGAQYDRITLAMIAEDPLVAEVFGAGRDAVALIASRLGAHEAFVGLQERGLAAGVIYSPDEVLTDPHFVERGFPVEIHHDEIGRSVVHPGPPIRFTATPMQVRRAPRLGEHTEEVLAELGR